MTMPYCHRCRTLTAKELRENDVPFHPNLRSLKESADRGCEFCFVCWTAFKKDAAKHVDGLLCGESPFPKGSEWTPAIWLNGNQFGHPTSGDSIAVSCGRRGPKSDFWPEVNPEPIEAVLEVYEEPGTRSKYNIRGRRSTSYQNPELYVLLIKQWMATCRAHHPRCSLTRGSEMPTRVIHVGDPASNTQPRLLATAQHGISEPYAALSYCWGPNTSNVPKLTDATYSSFVQGIDESKLSQSHKDMIHLARALGINYVWIDALCIIQFNTADWERESKRMAVVYGNAALTVIAGRSSDSNHGFIANNADQNNIFCKLPQEASEKIPTIMVGLKRSHDIGPTSTRAWCFQERLLSQRAVIFGLEQLRFSCRAGSVYEDGLKTAGSAGSKLLGSAPIQPPSRNEQHAAHEALKEWYGLLFPYTKCRLSNPHDAFASLSAMAQQAAAVLRSRYLAGVWECDIVRGLMWRPTYHLAPNWKPTTRPKATSLTASCCQIITRAPSWSWVSVEGEVSQESFVPPKVALYRDRSNFKIRPVFLHPEKWSEDAECGVDKLHMPACELRFMGRVVGARVLEESPRLRYTGLRKAIQKPVKTLAPSKYSVLLVGTGAPTGELREDELLGNVTALGHFDVQDERVGVSYVYCLQLIPKYGLILKRNPDGSYSRLGWFMLEQDEWFMSQVETDVRLG